MKRRILSLSLATIMATTSLNASSFQEGKSASELLEEATRQLLRSEKDLTDMVDSKYISVKSKYDFDYKINPEFKLPAEGSKAEKQNNPMKLRFINKSIVLDENTKLMWTSRTLLIPTYLEKAVEYCANLRLGDYDDWRVPTIKELVSVADFNSYEPTFSRKYFPGAPIIGDYWGKVRKTDEIHPLHGWHVGYDGHIMGQPADAKKLTRCVRGDNLTAFDRNLFVDNKNGTVTDNVTKLVWQQDFAPEKQDYRGAKRYCADLKLAGRDDWRVPHVKEIVSMMDHTKIRPAMDMNFFPQTKDDEYQDFVWASTLDPSWGTDSFSGRRYIEGRTPLAWAAESISGGAWKYWVTEKFLVRCVTDVK